jgi:glycosyltransferase involved in cell wall biosynthesis
MNKNRNLVFYYPLGEGAPSSVGRSVFEYLLKKRDELPFDNVSIFSRSRDKKVLESKFKGIPVLTKKDLLNIKNSVIHIPISPLVFPNTKFLLHLLAKFRNNVLVLNYHGDIRTEVSLNYKNNHSINYSYIPTYVLLPTILRSATQLVVHSYLFRELVFDKYGVTDAKVIPNAVGDYWRSPSYAPISLDKGRMNIFYHGRLSAEKGIDILVKGFAKFLEDNKNCDAMLFIAGDGPQRNYLEKIINDLNLHQHAVLLGNLDKSLIKGYLKEVDAAIYPSVWDNFPLSYIEAFTCANCPVYFSKKAGIYDFILQSNTQLYAFEPDANVVCNILHSICRKDFNPTIIEDQRNFALNYRWDNIINIYMNMYLEIK